MAHTLDELVKLQLGGLLVQVLQLTVELERQEERSRQPVTSDPAPGN